MRLIVTNGDVAAARIREAGIEGDIIPWRDTLHDGPVPDEDRLEDVSRIRAGFLASEFGMDRAEISLSFAERDAMLRRHAEYERVEIWVEHDLYDQLQLLQVLNFFAGLDRRSGMMLVQSEDYLGLLSLEDIKGLADRAKPVSEEQFALAARGWRAFTQPFPADLVEFAHGDTRALPHLGAALRRLLAEFPDPVRGLSLTEERMLRRLAEGPAGTAELFRHVLEQEDARFMSDLSFFRRIDGLAFGAEPLVWGVESPSPDARGNGDLSHKESYKAFASATLQITAAGRKVLKGTVDHALANQPERWIGGVRLRPALLMRYDRNSGQLIAAR